jgi:hypothetical protein
MRTKILQRDTQQCEGGYPGRTLLRHEGGIAEVFFGGEEERKRGRVRCFS